MSSFWDFVRNKLGGKPIEPPAQVPSKGYEQNLAYFRQSLGHPADLSMREFDVGKSHLKATVVYIEQIADKNKVAEQIILPLSSYAAMIDESFAGVAEARRLICAGDAKELLDLRQAEKLLLRGDALLLIRGYRPVIVCNVRAAVGRSVTTAEVETTIMGPKQAFVEQLPTNIALIRQKLRTASLRIESKVLGSETNTPVAMLYLKDVVPKQVLEELEQRLNRVEISEVLDVSYLAELLSISPFSPFPQAIYTERPDKVVGNLLEGRVALLVDGSPEALVLPAAFSDLLQSPGDYYARSSLALLLRVLRVLAFVTASSAPALYVAVITFDYELLPTDLIIPIASARSGLPFTPVQEALLMLLLVDILQEGAIRLPARIGQTLGVVGGLVLGQAVVQANLVSPLLLIVVASSVIGSFAMPNYQVNGLIRLLRYAFLLGGAIIGGAGVVLVWAALFIHMSSLTVLGVPYLRPLAPLRLGDLSDFIYRKPLRTREPEKASRLKGSPRG